MSIWDIIRVPFGYLLEFFYHLTGNYGIAMILFAIIVKLILLPMSIKSKKSSMKMARVSPKLKELERKYGNDKVKYQQALMDLYKEEGVSTTGGCLWSFVPLLILIPLYQVIREPMVYMMHMSHDTASAVVDAMLEMGIELGSNTYYQPMVAASKLAAHFEEVKAAVPALADLKIQAMNFSFLGLDLSSIPNWRVWTLTGWAGFGLFVIPVISGFVNWFSMWISQKLNHSVSTDEKGEKSEVNDAANSTMKSMIITMPLISVWIGFSMPAAMSVYWITQGLLGFIQETILTSYFRKVYDAEDLIKKQRAAEQAAIEAEKERIRAERRAKNPDGIMENTSKKKLKAMEKANRAPAVEGKLTPEERAALKEKKSESGDANRPYCRGRAYDPDRFGKNGAAQPAEDAALEATASEAAPADDAAEDTNK